jgi:hypothetical protein
MGQNNTSDVLLDEQKWAVSTLELCISNGWLHRDWFAYGMIQRH